MYARLPEGNLRRMIMINPFWKDVGFFAAWFDQPWLLDSSNTHGQMLIARQIQNTRKTCHEQQLWCIVHENDSPLLRFKYLPFMFVMLCLGVMPTVRLDRKFIFSQMDPIKVNLPQLYSKILKIYMRVAPIQQSEEIQVGNICQTT